jgi:hypothetical protein
MQSIGLYGGLIVSVALLVLFVITMVGILEINDPLKRIEQGLKSNEVEKTLRSIEQVLKSQAFSKEDKV